MKEYPTTLSKIQEGLREGSFTSVELVEAIYSKLEEVEPKVNAFITYKEAKETALEQAKAADERGYGENSPKLNGVPVAIKDNILVKDLKATGASKMLENFVAPFDATVVELLTEAGAVIIGKTNLDEFGMGGSTEHSIIGATHNPWNLDKVTGGSSGGSAASVAARVVPVSLGTDSGGSIRQPASFNGLVGLKPSYGLVSRYGVMAFASSFDTIGPLTLTVLDNAKVLNVLAGVDPKDSMTLPDQDVDYTAKIGESIEGKKIAIVKEMLGENVDPEIKGKVQEAKEYFEKEGAIVEEVSMEHLDLAVDAYYILSSAEASSNMQRYDGIHYGYRNEDAKNLAEIYKKTRSSGFGIEVKRRIMLGMYVLSDDNYERAFEQAARVRTLIKEDFKAVFNDYDLILSPTTTTTAYDLGGQVEDPKAMYAADYLTIPVNLAGLPAISIPAGFSKSGLPIGIQLIGDTRSEQELYQVAYSYEQAHDYSQERPEL